MYYMCKTDAAATEANRCVDSGDELKYTPHLCFMFDHFVCFWLKAEQIFFFILANIPKPIHFMFSQTCIPLVQ